MARKLLTPLNVSSELQANGAAGTAGQLLSSGGTGASPTWVEAGYRYVDTLYYTSTTSFTKASYPYLRAIKVTCVGGGGGGGGCATTAAAQNASGQAGAGGVTAESFITDIAGLASSVTVTVGAGGSGGAANGAGTDGTASSFGALVSANGGGNGLAGGAVAVPSNAVGVSGPSTGTGDIVHPGEGSEPRMYFYATATIGPKPGFSKFSQASNAYARNAQGQAGASANGYGNGGGAGINAQSQATTRAGGSGSDGIVVVELYA